jgi:hypothetical protein
MRAFSAAHSLERRGTIADLEARDGLTDGEHLADDLVTENGRQR